MQNSNPENSSVYPSIPNSDDKVPLDLVHGNNKDAIIAAFEEARNDKKNLINTSPEMPEDGNEEGLPNITGYTGAEKLSIIVNLISDLQNSPHPIDQLFRISWRCNEISGPDKFSLRGQFCERDWDLLDFLCEALIDPDLSAVLNNQISDLQTELNQLKPHLDSMAKRLKIKDEIENPTKKKTGKEKSVSSVPMLDALIGCWLDLKYINVIIQYIEVLREDKQLNNRYFRIAILRVIEVIGEYAKKISPDTMSVLPADDWKKLKELRNQIEHIRRGSWLTQEVEKLLEIDNKLFNDFFTIDLDIVYQQLVVVKSGLKALAQDKLKKPNENLKLTNFIKPDAVPNKIKLVNTAEILKQVFDKQNKLSPSDQRNLLAKTFNHNQANLYQAIYPKQLDIDFKIVLSNQDLEDIRQEWLKTTDLDRRFLVTYCQESNAWNFVGRNAQKNIIDKLPQHVMTMLLKIKDSNQQVSQNIIKRFLNVKGDVLWCIAECLGYDLDERHLFTVLGQNDEQYNQLAKCKKDLEKIQEQLNLVDKKDQKSRDELIKEIAKLNAELKRWKGWFELLGQRIRYLKRNLNEEAYGQKVSGMMQSQLSPQQLKFKQILNHEQPIAKLEDFDTLVKELVPDQTVANEVICEVGDKLNLDEEALKLMTSDNNRRKKTELYHVIKEVKTWFNDVVALGNLAGYYLNQNNNDLSKLQRLFNIKSFYYLAAQKLLEIINETSERLMNRQIYNQYFAHSENISPSRLLLFKRFRGGIAHRPMVIDQNQVVWFFYHWVVDAHFDLHQLHQKVQATTVTSTINVDDSAIDLAEYHIRSKLTSTHFRRQLEAISSYCQTISSRDDILVVGGLLGCDVGIQANLNLIFNATSQSVSSLELLDIQWKLTRLLGLTISITTFANFKQQTEINVLQIHRQQLLKNSMNLFEFNFQLEMRKDYQSNRLCEISLSNGTKARRGQPGFTLENAIKSVSVIYLLTKDEYQKWYRTIVLGRNQELSKYQEKIKLKAKILTDALIKRINALPTNKRVTLCRVFELEKTINQLTSNYFKEHKTELMSNVTSEVKYIDGMFNYCREIMDLNFDTILDGALITNLKQLIERRDKLFSEFAALFDASMYQSGGYCKVNLGNNPLVFFLGTFENVSLLLGAYSEFASLRAEIIPKSYFEPPVFEFIGKGQYKVNIQNFEFYKHHQQFVMAFQCYSQIRLLSDEVLSPGIFKLASQVDLDQEEIILQVCQDFQLRFVEPEENIINFKDTERQFAAYKYPFYLEIKEHSKQQKQSEFNEFSADENLYAVNDNILMNIMYKANLFSRHVAEYKKRNLPLVKMVFADDRREQLIIESLVKLPFDFNCIRFQSIEAVGKFLFSPAINNLKDLLSVYGVADLIEFYPDDYQVDNTILTDLVDFKRRLSRLEQLYTRINYLINKLKQKEFQLAKCESLSVSAALMSAEVQELKLEIDNLHQTIVLLKAEIQSTNHFKNVISNRFPANQLWQQIAEQYKQDTNNEDYYLQYQQRSNIKPSPKPIPIDKKNVSPIDKSMRINEKLQKNIRGKYREKAINEAIKNNKSHLNKILISCLNYPHHETINDGNCAFNVVALGLLYHKTQGIDLFTCHNKFRETFAEAFNIDLESFTTMVFSELIDELLSININLDKPLVKKIIQKLKQVGPTREGLEADQLQQRINLLRDKMLKEDAYKQGNIKPEYHDSGIHCLAVSGQLFQVAMAIALRKFCVEHCGKTISIIQTIEGKQTETSEKLNTNNEFGQYAGSIEFAFLADTFNLEIQEKIGELDIATQTYGSGLQQILVFVVRPGARDSHYELILPRSASNFLEGRLIMDPMFIQHYIELENIIHNYSITSLKVRYGFFAGKLPIHLREINDQLQRVRAGTCSIRQAVENIIQISQKMGSQHPILKAAQAQRNAQSSVNPVEIQKDHLKVGKQAVILSSNFYT